MVYFFFSQETTQFCTTSISIVRSIFKTLFKTLFNFFQISNSNIGDLKL